MTHLENPNYQRTLELHSNYLMREVVYAEQGETGFEEVDYWIEDECFSPLVFVDLVCQPIDNEVRLMHELDHLIEECNAELNEPNLYVLVKLVDNTGKVYEQRGYAIEGMGIIDTAGDFWIAGYDDKGKLYATEVDSENYVLNMMGERVGLKL